MPAATLRIGRPTVAMIVLALRTAHCFTGRAAFVSFAYRRGANPRMDATGDEVQLEAEILLLKKQLAEMQARQTAPAEAPVPSSAEVIASPPLLPVPAPTDTLTSASPLPMPAPVVSQQVLPEVEKACLDLSGNPKECTEPIDFNEFINGIKPASSLAPENLLQPETAVPLVIGLATLVVGYDAISKAAESLRPDDAATARRKREERDRLGISNLDLQAEEEEQRIARDNMIQTTIAIALILGVELALFNLRGVWGGG